MIKKILIIFSLFFFSSANAFYKEQIISELKKINKVWLHTCSLDHQNALNNYLARGMKIFKKEKVFL